jgi:hypothetical protein
MLNVSLFDIYRMAEAKGIRLGADEDQQQRSKGYATRGKLVPRNDR